MLADMIGICPPVTSLIAAPLPPAVDGDPVDVRRAFQQLHLSMVHRSSSDIPAIPVFRDRHGAEPARRRIWHRGGFFQHYFFEY